MLEHGQLYHKRSTDTTFTELNKQNGDSVEILFTKTKVLFAETKELHKPGNVYCSIKVKRDSTTKELAWLTSKESSPESVKDLYKELMNLVNLK